MATIKAPNKNYTGVSAGVQFVNGEGQTDDQWKIQWFKNKGYQVIEEKKKKSPSKKDDDKK